MIQSFRDADARALFQGRTVPRWRAIRRQAERRLNALDAAQVLGDLAGLPSHRLEKLKGKRAGQYSIRINDQWRICFTWSTKGPQQVEIVDYHGGGGGE